MSNSSRTHRHAQNLLMLFTVLLLIAAQRYMLPESAVEPVALQITSQQSCIECSQFPAWE